MTKRSGLADILSLTPLQEGMLFQHLYDEEALDVYNVQVFIELGGQIDVGRLRGAVDGLLRRHANLRAVFRQRNTGEWVQLIPRHVEVPWQHVDLGELPESDSENEATRLADDDRWRRFDLRQPPLLRFTLIRLGPDRHRLVMTNHHILLDGWSMPILLRELMTLYGSDGQTAGMPAVRPYRDYLAWLHDRDREAARRAWTAYLDDLDAPTVVAADRPVLTTPPQRLAFTVPPATADALAGLARREGVTMNTVMQAAWALTLAHHTNTTDITFGTTVSGRPPEIDGINTMIGLFINTQPVRITVHPHDTITELLHHIQKRHTALLDHQWTGLADIQNWAGVPTLFDTAMVFENYPPGANRSGSDADDGPQVLRIHSRDSMHYPLGLLVSPRESLHCSLGYLPDVFGEAEVQAYIGTFVRVLDTIAAAPESLVGRLDLLAADDRRRVLRDGDGGTATLPATTLPELFEQQVALTPDAVALLSGPVVVTYAQVNAAANRLARALIASGAGPETTVALSMPRGIDLITAMLATVKAGAAYLPIDPDYPTDRIQHMLTDAAPVLHLSNLDDVPADDQPAHDVTDADRRAPLNPRHPAYVIYTSGSTGAPKGAVIEHRALSAYLVRCREAHPDVTGLAVLHSSVAFDQSVGAIHVPLVSGGRVRIAALDELADVVGGERPRFMKATPSHLPVLAALPDRVSPAGTITFGGEPLRAEPLDRWRRRHPDTTVLNVYGPTETTVHCVEERIAPGAPLTGVAVPIGRPTANVRVLVLDSALRLVPPGVTGELYIAGAQLARGYHRRAALTGERFVANPYGRPGERMYRTGDLARWNHHGHLEYHGRTDHQIKLRGHRIELGEIEAALLNHPQVTTAAVLLREDQPGDQRLVAYLTLQPDARFDVEESHRHLGSTLPAYMVPSAIVVLAELPTTVNGKLDRRALPAPDYRSTGRAPRTPHEEILCDLFADVLGVSQVSIDDGFFDLGGHSLLATRLVSRIRATLDVELPIRQVFETPTVATLAATLDSAAHARPPVTPVVPRPERVPLSPAQQRLWFLHQLQGPSTTYNIPTALRLRGPLNTTALTEALHDLVTRHESLRTVFAEDQHGPHQIVLPADTAAITLNLLPTDPTRLADEIDAATRHTFDLATDLPIHATLLRLADDDHVLILLLHHITSDAWSRHPLATDLATAYTARIHQHQPDWTPLPVQYADYTLWQQRLLADTHEQQLAYWSTTLADLPEHLTLPTDRPRPATASSNGDRVTFTIPTDLHHAITTLA
ncbi:amino acid adenylation domain-containing protein, partial [Micromonospora sp. NPDC005215]|uniref:amino acid adenylation domain-containing protein n=1 Tax=Micromonospora sp. NPDC005215 TaxID=3157024 RepID=UPI0033AA0BFF